MSWLAKNVGGRVIDLVLKYPKLILEVAAMVSASFLALGLSLAALYFLKAGFPAEYYEGWSWYIPLACCLVAFFWWARDAMRALKTQRKTELWTREKREGAVAIRVANARTTVRVGSDGTMRLDRVNFEVGLCNATPWKVESTLASVDTMFLGPQRAVVASQYGDPCHKFLEAPGATLQFSDRPVAISIRDLEGLRKFLPQALYLVDESKPVRKHCCLSLALVFHGAWKWEDGVTSDLCFPLDVLVTVLAEFD